MNDFYVRISRDGQSVAANMRRLNAAGAWSGDWGGHWGGAGAAPAAPHGRLKRTGLGGFAAFACELIRARTGARPGARTGEFRARAAAPGVQMERKPRLAHHRRRDTVTQYAAGKPMREIAGTYDVSHSRIACLTG
jgi:hypothetical protein